MILPLEQGPDQTEQKQRPSELAAVRTGRATDLSPGETGESVEKTGCSR
jgi:hypothetical protein